TELPRELAHIRIAPTGSKVEQRLLGDRDVGRFALLAAPHRLSFALLFVLTLAGRVGLFDGASDWLDFRNIHPPRAQLFTRVARRLGVDDTGRGLRFRVEGFVFGDRHSWSARK